MHFRCIEKFGSKDRSGRSSRPVAAAVQSEDCVAPRCRDVRVLAIADDQRLTVRVNLNRTVRCVIVPAARARLAENYPLVKCSPVSVKDKSVALYRVAFVRSGGFFRQVILQIEAIQDSQIVSAVAAKGGLLRLLPEPVELS